MFLALSVWVVITVFLHRNHHQLFLFNGLNVFILGYPGSVGGKGEKGQLGPAGSPGNPVNSENDNLPDLFLYAYLS